MTPTEKAKKLLRNRTTHDLIIDFIISGKTSGALIPTVRGWIMDELERRNLSAFMRWLDQDNPTDESLLLYFDC